VNIEESLARMANDLRSAGATRAFGITGSGPSLMLVGALERAGVRYLGATHEASAAIMAGAATRVGSAPAISISIKGPGLVNALAGISYNRFEDIPSISIAEAYGASAPRWREHKRVDQGGILQPIVKGHFFLSEWPDRSREILSCAATETPGPVHVDLCDGISTAIPPDKGGGTPPVGRLDPLVRRIRSASRPVVIVGSVVQRMATTDLLERLSVPVFTTAAGRGAIDESSPFAAGVFTGDGKERSPEAKLLAQSDLVVAVGLRSAELTGQGFGGQPIVRVDHPGQHAREFPRPIESDVVCDADGFREALEALAGVEWGARAVSDSLAQLRASFECGGWMPGHCFLRVDALDSPHILVIDTGSFCTIGEHAWRARPRRVLVGSNNGRFMGGGLPSAVGASLAAPGVPVYCALGDGGMQAYPGELKAIVAEQLPICVIFMSDGQYGSIACAAPASAPVSALRMRSPNWSRVAEAIGMPAVECEDCRAFDSAFAAWNRTGPVFIECRFDRDEYLLMTKGLR